MTTIVAADYWPQFFAPVAGKTGTRFAYPAVGALPGYTSTFYFDPSTGCMKLDQYDLSNNWMSSWYLRVENSGLFEVQDDLPQNNAFLKAVFGPVIIERYSTPIGWGGTQQLGAANAYYNAPSFATFECSPPQIGHGLQVVVFEALFPTWTDALGNVWSDVLQVFYQQEWNNGTPEGARMWMPRGVGPIAAQWVSGSTTEPVQTATVTHF